MKVYYNDNNKFVADWLRNLVAAGQLPDGDVDDRSIVDVRPSDLKGYIQCHFFAGCGGWPLAMRIAGWPSISRAWSGSAPCQPWSRARITNKNGAKTRDDRDLWPIFFELLKACKPEVYIGEQVTGPAAREWAMRMQRDIWSLDYKLLLEKREASDYGSPQKRSRYYFLAYTGRKRVLRLEPSSHLGGSRFWRWRRETDMQLISRSPFERADRWPQPLLRRGDARIPGRMDIIRAYGNAIDPWVAAQFLADACSEKKAEKFV